MSNGSNTVIVDADNTDIQDVLDIPADADTDEPDTSDAVDETPAIVFDADNSPNGMPTWTEYRNADKAGKKVIKDNADKMFRDALNVLNPASPDMMRYMDGYRATATKAVIDVNALISARIATFRLAADLLETGIVVPTGANRADDATDESDMSDNAATTWDNTDMTDDGVRFATNPADADVSDAVALAGRRVTKNKKSYDVAEVITNAFIGVPSGTFLTVREMCKKSDYPHDGAVSARLFPARTKSNPSGTCTVPNIVPFRPGMHHSGSPAGAEKA